MLAPARFEVIENPRIDEVERFYSFEPSCGDSVLQVPVLMQKQLWTRLKLQGSLRSFVLPGQVVDEVMAQCSEDYSNWKLEEQTG